MASETWDPCAELVVVPGFISGEFNITESDPESGSGSATLASTHGCSRDKAQTPRGPVDIPRGVCIVSPNEDFGYSYGGQKAKRAKASARELDLMDKMNKGVERITGVSDSINALLKNHYRDENDSVSEHQDNEQELTGGLVAAVSIGEKRQLVFRPALSKKFMTKHSITRTDDAPVCMEGRMYVTVVYNKRKYRVIQKPFKWTDPTKCLWIMKGKEFQTLLTHEVPKSKIKGLKGRISFTGRKHNKETQ